MVTKNQWQDSGWWDDLPPKLRQRFSGVVVDEPAREAKAETACEPPFPAPFRWLGDYGVLAVLFFAVALTNVFLLLIMLALVEGVGLPWPF